MKQILIIALATFSLSAAYAEDQVEVGKLIPADELTFQLDTEDMELDIQEDIELDKQQDLGSTERSLGDYIKRRLKRKIRKEILGDDYYDDRRRRMVVCEAENRRGRIYRAEGRRPWRVQQRALRRCERNSRWCYELGCRRVRRGGWR